MAASSTEPSSLRRFAPRIGLMLAALLTLAWFQRPDARLHIFFPALHGDAALVQTPNGTYLLIDGGSDPDALVTALGRRMPFWQRDLALVILTSPRDAAQVAALERYRAHGAIALPSAAPDATRDAWQRMLPRDAVPVRTFRVGQRLEIDGVTIQTLDCDDAGALIRLDYGATSIVFAHSVTVAMLEHRFTRRASLLVYPWQYDPHTPLVESLRPAAIIFSDGRQSRHPPQQTYHERAVGGARLYHEQIDGDIEWVSDGRRPHIITSKPAGQ